VTIAFLEMQEYVRRVTEAELLIMHAGAGSVIHAIQAGKVPVIMPRCVHYGEHVNDHQVEFAEALAATGKVVVANGKDDLWSMSLEALARQKDAQEAGGNQGMSLLISRIDRTLREYAGQKPT
jgi:UDP-N-acetylglucosamine transferase subunit ALG13